MPKHARRNADKTLDLIRKTQSIRKSKPTWAVGLATLAFDEDGKKVFTAIALPKLGSAKTEVQKLGLRSEARPKAGKLTQSYAWMEGGKVVLSPLVGQFGDAKTALNKYLEAMKVSRVSIVPCKDPLTAKDIDAIESTPDNVVDAMFDEAEAAEPAAEDSDAEVEPADDAPADAAEPTPDTAAPTPPDEIEEIGRPDDLAAVAPLTTQDIQLTQQQVKAVVSSLDTIFARLAIPLIVAHAEREAEMNRRYQMHLASLVPPRRAALAETAPPRLLIEAARAIVMGWPLESPADDVLRLHEPETPVSLDEVVRGYTDIGMRVMHRENRRRLVSRPLIQKRVEGFFPESGSLDDKMLAIERLNKAFLPQLADVNRLDKTFGAPYPPGPHRLVDPTVQAINDFSASYGESLQEIFICRDIYTQNIENEGEVFDDSDEDFFRKMEDDFASAAQPSVEAAKQLATRLEAGTMAPDLAVEIAALRGQVSGVKGKLSAMADNLDNSDFSGTTLRSNFFPKIDALARALDRVA